MGTERGQYGIKDSVTKYISGRNVDHRLCMWEERALKFKHFNHIRDKTWIYVLPTIVIKTDDLSYCEKNFALEIHIIIWHFRWFWVKEGGRTNDK